MTEEELLPCPVIFNRAADIIAERGLTQGSWQNSAGQVCAIGALQLACGLTAGAGNHNAQLDKCAAAFAAKVSKQPIDDGTPFEHIEQFITQWNDRRFYSRETIFGRRKPPKVVPQKVVISKLRELAK